MPILQAGGNKFSHVLTLDVHWTVYCQAKLLMTKSRAEVHYIILLWLSMCYQASRLLPHSVIKRMRINWWAEGRMSLRSPLNYHYSELSLLKWILCIVGPKSKTEMHNIIFKWHCAVCCKQINYVFSGCRLSIFYHTWVFCRSNLGP